MNKSRITLISLIIGFSFMLIAGLIGDISNYDNIASVLALCGGSVFFFGIFHAPNLFN